MLRIEIHLFMRHLLIFALGIATLIPVFSQTPASRRSMDLDSLEKAVMNLRGDEQVKGLLRLSQGYARKSLDKSIEHAQAAMDLALRQNNFSQLVIACDLLGQGHSRLGNHFLSMGLFEKGLKYARQLGNEEKEAHLMNSIGIEYAKTGDYEKALAYLPGSLEIWRKMGDRKQVAVSLNNIGLLQLKLDRPALAIATLEEAMGIARQLPENQDILSSSLNNLGQVNEEIADFDKALDYYKQALELKKGLRKPLATLPSYANIFSIYSQQQRFDSARVYFDLGWAIAEQQQSKEWLRRLLETQGDAADLQGKSKEAIVHYLQSLTYAKRLHSDVAIMELEEKLGDVYARLDSFETAFRYNKSAALRNDSIFNEKRLSQIAEMQAKYDLTEMEVKIEAYKKEELVNHYRLLILLVVVVLSLTALLAIFSRYRLKQQAAVQLEKRNRAIEEKGELLQKKSLEILAKNRMLQSQSEAMQLQNERLAQSNADLERFAYVASHDLREPLRTIRMHIQVFERRYGERLDENALEFIRYASVGAVRMDDLLQDLMEYSRIGRAESQKRLVNLNLILERVIDSLTVQIAENNAKVTYAPLPSIFAFETEMHQLFQNIISNGIKFRRAEAPEIRIGVRKEEDNYLFFIADNGIGIPEGEQERVFTIFQRLHTREEYEGTGIGLAICYKIVQGHGGSIRFESVPGKGTIFYISLPANGIVPQDELPSPSA